MHAHHYALSERGNPRLVVESSREVPVLLFNVKVVDTAYWQNPSINVLILRQSASCKIADHTSIWLPRSFIFSIAFYSTRIRVRRSVVPSGLLSRRSLHISSRQPHNMQRNTSATFPRRDNSERFAYWRGSHTRNVLNEFR